MITNPNGARSALRQASSLVIRAIRDVNDAERLLPPPVLRRLNARGVPGVRRGDLSASHVIVALAGETVVGLVAYKVASGPVRVAHEFAVDAKAEIGVAEIVDALVHGIEGAVQEEGGSRVVVVVPPAMPVRSWLERAGYLVTLAGREAVWLEKGLFDGESHLPPA